MKNLFILESPNKVKKIQGFLGTQYHVTATKGHFRNLGTRKELGIDIDNNFQPTYIIDAAKSNIVKNLKFQLDKSDIVYLATDYDREGEAIGWHVFDELNIEPSKCKRVIFTEITKKAITDSLKAPVDLDMNMVNAQQARMVLDKLIGYKVSPCLWDQFRNYKLSAGRVQSVVTKLIIEREKEILAFQSSNYFKLFGLFSLDKEKMIKNPIKFDIQTECESRIEDKNIIQNLLNKTKDGNIKYTISQVKKSTSKRRPQAPFITSSLQQEASNKLGMSPDVCMSSAQRLYEAGLITYMRTDSLILSEESLGNIENYVKKEYGEKYHKKTQYNKKKAKGAQEAHEACRPTNVQKFNVTDVDKITSRDNKLYQLIWKRTVASQMSPADVEIKTIKVKSEDISKDSKSKDSKSKDSKSKKLDDLTFTGKFEKILFDGFLKVYQYQNEDNNNDNNDEDNNEDDNKKNKISKKEQEKQIEALFKKCKEGNEVFCNCLDGQEKQTKASVSRFTEASLIKKLEELGIGRPSTYASMVTKVQDKDYVEKRNIDPVEKDFNFMKFTFPDTVTNEIKKVKVQGEKNKLIPTGIGSMVNTFLLQHFDNIMDYGFTASVESQLDEIANGKIVWNIVVKNVYDTLYPIIDKLAKALMKNGQTPSGGKKNPATKIELGKNNSNGLNICVIQTRFGWSICEENPDKKKSRWASVGNLDPNNINLQKALSMLIYPKQLGNYKGNEIKLMKARSIYIKYGTKNYSIDIYKKSNQEDKDLKPENIDFEKAKQIIDFSNESMSKGQEKKTFTENKDIVVSNGRYGYYIKYNGKNIPLPTKWKKDISELTLQDCQDIIDKKNGKTNTNTKTETKNKNKSKAKAKPKSESTNKPKSKDKPKSESNAKPKSESKAKAKPKSESKAKAKSESKAKAKPKSESKAKAKTSNETKPKTKAKGKTSSETKANTKGKAKGKSESDKKTKK